MPKPPPPPYITISGIIHYLLTHPFPVHTKPCPSYTLSCTKPSARSPTSFATMATTGTNSAQAQPTPCGKPQKPPSHKSNHQVTRPPKTKDSLPLNCSYRRTHTKFSSFPYTMPTSGECIKRPKHPFGQWRRSTSQQTLQTGTS